MDELRLILNQTIWVRRLKQEVLKQLPAKVRKMVYLKIPELKSEKKKQNKNFIDQFANIENLSAGIGFIIHCCGPIKSLNYRHQLSFRFDPKISNKTEPLFFSHKMVVHYETYFMLHIHSG